MVLLYSYNKYPKEVIMDSSKLFNKEYFISAGTYFWISFR